MAPVEVTTTQCQDCKTAFCELSSFSRRSPDVPQILRFSSHFWHKWYPFNKSKLGLFRNGNILKSRHREQRLEASAGGRDGPRIYKSKSKKDPEATRPGPARTQTQVSPDAGPRGGAVGFRYMRSQAQHQFPPPAPGEASRGLRTLTPAGGRGPPARVPTAGTARPLLSYSALGQRSAEPARRRTGGGEVF